MTMMPRFLERALTRYRQCHLPPLALRCASLSPEELARWLTEGQALQVLDIRNGEAFAAGHLPGALNAPLSDFDSVVQRLNRHAPTVVY